MRMKRGIAALVFGVFLAATGQAQESSSLEVAEVGYQTLAREQVFDAVIEAVKQATISAQTSGQITDIYFDVDDYVPKDAVLLRFRDKEQRAAVQAAEARFEEARSNFTRVRDLLSRKLVPRSEFDKAEAVLKAAQAELNRAREQLEYTVVRAPYSGIVVERHVEPGETARPGQPLMTGLSLEELRAVANVPQLHIQAVRGLARARVILPAAVDGSVEAANLTFSPYADPESHTFKVRVDLPPGQHGVYPGMYVKAAFVVGEEKRLVVPMEAVVYRSEVTAVYVVGDDGKISFRQIRVGRILEAGNIEVFAGLEVGEKVALDPIRAGVQLKKARAGEAS